MNSLADAAGTWPFSGIRFLMFRDMQKGGEMKRVLLTLVFFGLATMTAVPVMAADQGHGAAVAAKTARAADAAPDQAKADKTAAAGQAPATDQAPAARQKTADKATAAGKAAANGQAGRDETAAAAVKPAAGTAATPARAAEELKPVPLTNSDCVKCHFDIAKDLDAHGGAHLEVNCTGCHQEHPPSGTNAIPSCSECHDPGENKHFATKGCTSCHNPHHPLELNFTTVAATKPACLTCHPDKGKEMAAHPSAHAEQDCNSCHNQHGLGPGQYQTCLDCHEGHTPDMTIKDCLKCHKPHSPTDITYGDDIPVAFCAACHDDIAATLAKSGTKHSEMRCVECHDGRHGKITPCVDCHDQPHDPYIHKKFPECLTCHRDPHNLAR